MKVCKDMQNWGEVHFSYGTPYTFPFMFKVQYFNMSQGILLPNKFLIRKWFPGRRKKVVGFISVCKVRIPKRTLPVVYTVWLERKEGPVTSPLTLQKAEVRWYYLQHLCFTYIWPSDLWLTSRSTFEASQHSCPETWPANNSWVLRSVFGGVPGSVCTKWCLTVSQ